MMKNIEVQHNGGVSKSSNLFAGKERVDEALGVLKIEDNGDDTGGAYGAVCFPDRPGEPDCIYYLRTGKCGYGSRCRFNHPSYSSQGHQNSGVLPEREGKPECRHYIRTGICKFGSACRYHHPQDRHNSDPLLLNIWGFPMRKGTMGGSSILDDLADQTFGGQIPLLSSSSHQPDRPDQPECHDFVNTGSCKYGADCKYYHPRNKVAPTTSNLLGPLGLPLRPGQAVCSYYAMHGLCRYGPTCKYDHPLAGYVGVPSLVFNTSVVPYQWNSPTVPSTETSPSMSSKLPDLSRSSEVTMQKGQNSNTEKLLHIGAPPSTSQRPLEVQQDESD
ncbi:zinc finger CCCH domain-containing protein 3 isoform X3 [Coffea arabica]|uniref:Zinc finger CCCH domain-containing protein 3 isoform X3 n=1 Tax=Coffea arabica TaxID=13443 RepID=A0ABM4UBG0_COFAR